ncbi:MAG: zf-HC2 domain-containing protein [Bacteroidetes bacterium]|nr:zf-HC2 domain-containing protein [Bacteroidota bacterium]
MNCEQYQEHISQFIDGELENVNESSLFQHLSTCDDCRGFLKETLSLRSELLNNHTAIVPDSLNRKILSNNMITPGSRKSMSSHFDWMKQGRMMSLKAVGLILAFSILTSVIFTSLWYQSNIASQETIVYVPTLPTEEVRGYVSTTSNLPH